MRKCFVFLITILSLWSCRDLIEERNVESVQTEMEEGIKLYAQKTMIPETRGIALSDNLWEVGQTIRIKFLNGTNDQIEKVKLYAGEWLQYANLQFEYVDYLDQADVKIAFQWNGDPVTWSVVGTEAKLVNQNLPSLNFGNLSLIERFFKRDVLMQFGHVLGLVNEHKNENNPIELDEEVVYAYYFEQGWSIREITDFFFRPYSSAITNYTEYDSESIMVWPIPEDLTLNGIGQSRNNELSQTDKDFIGTLYPFVPPTDYVTTFGIHITSASPTIGLDQVLNTTGHVKVDFGDGSIYEGPGDLIPYHYYYHTHDGYDAIITVEAEQLSLNFDPFDAYSTRVYRLKLNGFTEYERIDNSSQSFVTIETDPLRPPVILQEEFPGFWGTAVLRSIPENIYQGAVNAKSFFTTFRYCRSLMSIPGNLFANNPNVTDFISTFVECNSLTSIPENLFANNPNVTNFEGTFYFCPGLTSIPENLFANNPNVTNFSRIFSSCSNLSNIPENLFANNPNVIDFNNAFGGCENLTSIPESLFANNPNVTNFSGTFFYCQSLTSIPDNLFANNLNVRDFSYTFADCTNLTGYAPRLWEREGVIGTACFRGCTGLANYDEIPDDWK